MPIHSLDDYKVLNQISKSKNTFKSPKDWNGRFFSLDEVIQAGCESFILAAFTNFQKMEKQIISYLKALTFFQKNINKSRCGFINKI